MTEAPITQFEFAFVDKRFYDEEPLCPHCECNVKENKMLVFVNTRQLVGKVQQCIECHRPFMIVSEPKLEQRDIYTVNWLMKEG